jgi:hypothetical protein
MDISKCIKIILRYFFLSLGILFLLCLVSLFSPKIIHYERGIYYGYDLILEHKFTKIFENVVKTKNFQPIQLQNFSDSKIIRACVQGPYTPQDYYEGQIGQKVDNFNETDDGLDGYVIWLFFSDGSITRFRTNLQFWYDVDKPRCTEKSLTISFGVNDKRSGHINFFFIGN